MKKLHSARQGFTLIELLIVSSITLIVVAAAIASLTTFQARQRALVAAKNVQQLMWSAQVKARVREVPTHVDCQNPLNPLRGYYVNVQATSARLYARCGNTNVAVQDELNYPLNVRVSANTGTYMFHTLERGVSKDAVGTVPSETTAPVPEFWTLTFCTWTGSACAAPASSPSFTLRVGVLGWVSGITSSFGAVE